jgi:hypothetical protein
MREMRNAHNIFVRKSEGKRQLGRPRHRCDDNIIDSSEIGWEDVDWMHQAQNRDRWWALLNAIMNIQVP